MKKKHRNLVISKGRELFLTLDYAIQYQYLQSSILDITRTE